MALISESPKIVSRPPCRRKSPLNAAAGFILMCALPLASSWAKDYKWIVGRFVSADITGYGPKADNKSQPASMVSDIWWTYRISAGGMTHLAVTRESPSRIGIAQGAKVSFAIDKKSIFIRDSSKMLHSLKIIRSGATKDWR